MTYTQNQVAQTELARYKAKRELDIAEQNLEEAKRANRASEALKHEANIVSRESAQLAKEGRTESATISAGASKYATDTKALTDSKYIALETQKIANDFSIAKEANVIKRITAESGAKLNQAQVKRIGAEMQQWQKQLLLERERLNEQKELWRSQANLNNVNADLRPIEVTIDGVNKALSRVNDFLNTGMTNRRDVLNFVNEQQKRANEQQNTLINMYNALDKTEARKERDDNE